MQKLANEPLTDEQRERFEKEVRVNNQIAYRMQRPERLKASGRKSKGEKKRAKRDRLRYGYST